MRENIKLFKINIKFGFSRATLIAFVYNQIGIKNEYFVELKLGPNNVTGDDTFQNKIAMIEQYQELMKFHTLVISVKGDRKNEYDEIYNKIHTIFGDKVEIDIEAITN